MLEPVTLIAPINNSTIYSNNPRIIFNLNDGEGSLIIYITLSNSKGIFNYTSSRNSELFSKLAYNAFDNVTFISKDIVEGENKISIRVYDNIAFTSEKDFAFIYKESLLAINDEVEAITAAKYKYLLTMTNDTLTAYGKPIITIDLPIANESKLYKNYFNVINNSLYDLNNWININYPGLNKIKTKQLIGLSPFDKKTYNNILNLIVDI